MEKPKGGIELVERSGVQVIHSKPKLKATHTLCLEDADGKLIHVIVGDFIEMTPYGQLYSIGKVARDVLAGKKVKKTTKKVRKTTSRRRTYTGNWRQDLDELNDEEWRQTSRRY